MPCNSVHPAVPEVRCQSSSSGTAHDRHYFNARFSSEEIKALADEDGMIWWPNADYKPPAPAPTPKADMNAKLVEMTRRIPRERRVGAVARTGDPETSWEAARSLGDVRDSQREVLLLLRSHGPMTDEQVETRAREVGSRQTGSGLRTRRRELVDAGLVVWTGRWDVNQNGNRTRVWEAIKKTS